MAHKISELIKFFGSQVLTAQALGISQASVSYWLSGAQQISPEKAFLAELMTGGAIKASSLCTLLAQVEARHNLGESSTNEPVHASGPDGAGHASSPQALIA